MSGQPERCYAVEELKSLQSSIADLTQSMVIQRARVEKYKDTDLAAARDNFSLLQAVRRKLAEAIGKARLFLMEAEEYQNAKTAAMLQAGLLRFDLMSNVYRPVYDAIQDFIKKFPVDGTANAAVIGRLMNNVRLGYYPTDPDNISLILRGIQFPEEVTTNLFDPCCGCGKALRQLAQGNHCYAYGVELDESRAEEAQTRLHRVGFGSFFFSQISHEAFHLLFLNPPYLSVLNEFGGRTRHEKRFLIESLPHLMYGGLLVYGYQERCDYLIQSGSQSPAVMDRWVLKVQGLEEKKKHYEQVLQRELDGLDDEFNTLKFLAQELQVRANSIRFQKAA